MKSSISQSSKKMPVAIKPLNYEEKLTKRVSDSIVLEHKPGVKKRFSTVKNPIYDLNTKPNDTNPITPGVRKMNFVSCYKSRSGVDISNKKKINQDSYIHLKNIFNLSNFHLFGVLDGHGIYGHDVSSRVSEFFSKFFSDENNYLRQDEHKSKLTEEIIYDKLHKDNYELIRKAFILSELCLSSIDITNSGTTCVLVFLVKDKIISANVGDSRAIMLSTKGIYPLSSDHKPDIPTEMSRIIKSGGEVNKSEDDVSHRVWVKDRPYPGIAMSRSIGDSIATSVGVISEPEIKSFSFTSEVNSIVLATDGIWEFIDNEKIYELTKGAMLIKDPELACKNLVKAARKFWKLEDVVIDDITVIVLYFINE